MTSRRLIPSILILLWVGGGAIAQKKDKVPQFGATNATVYDIDFIGNTKLAVADGINIKIYNINDQKLINELIDGHQDIILSIDVSSDNSKLISAGRDGTICLWDLNNDQIINRLNYHKGVVTTVKFSPDNRYILSGGSDKQIVLYDLISSKETTIFSGHTDHILSVDFHPSGNIIASSAADGQVILWSTKTGERISTINNLKGWQRDISFSADSTKLISCGDNANIHVWDISNQKSVQLSNQLKEGRDWLLTQNLHTDGKTIVSGGMAGEIRINHSFGMYTYKIKKPITKVLFYPNEGTRLEVIASTMGGGVIMVDAKNMKSRN